jgi:hypothetical protein
MPAALVDILLKPHCINNGNIKEVILGGNMLKNKEELDRNYVLGGSIFQQMHTLTHTFMYV